MAITVRKGYESQFDINKMLPGEFAVTTDTHKVYVCMAAGISKELASVEELRNILDASGEAFEAFQELINAMEDGAVVTGLLNDISNLKSGNYTISFSEAEAVENIETTDTVKIIFGKIKKVFSSLSNVALTGKSVDVTYDNSNSGLEAENVQGAIDEAKAKLDPQKSVYYTGELDDILDDVTNTTIYAFGHSTKLANLCGYWVIVEKQAMEQGNYYAQKAVGSLGSATRFYSGGAWSEWKSGNKNTIQFQGKLVATYTSTSWGNFYSLENAKMVNIIVKTTAGAVVLNTMCATGTSTTNGANPLALYYGNTLVCRAQFSPDNICCLMTNGYTAEIYI